MLLGYLPIGGALPGRDKSMKSIIPTKAIDLQ